MEPNYKRLVTYKRNGLIEQEHSGLILHINKSKIINSVGEDNNYKFYQRSCMKPLQLAKIIDLKIDKKYSFSIEEIAVSAASHTGTQQHQNLVISILKKIGLDEPNLLCAKQIPLCKDEENRLIKAEKIPKPIHNNCSGKHSAMLALCLDKGWDINNYLDDEHPLNNEIIQKVAELCELKNSDFIISKDGCGLPTIATTLFEMGIGFLNLFLSNKYSSIRQGFIEYPYIIGGKNRLDSEIINASNDKKLIAKVGAGGLCVVVNIEKEEALVVKVADANMKARSMIVIESLRQLKWLDEKEISSNSISCLFDDSICTLEGELIGKIECYFALA